MINRSGHSANVNPRVLIYMLIPSEGMDFLMISVNKDNAAGYSKEHSPPVTGGQGQYSKQGKRQGPSKKEYSERSPILRSVLNLFLIMILANLCTKKNRKAASSLRMNLF